MTQKIRVTGGYVGEVSVLVKDLRGADLSGAGLQMVLVPLSGSLPARTDAAWRTPSTAEYSSAGSEGDGASRARLTLLVSSSTPLGRYRVWTLASLSPTSVPIMAEDEIIEVL